MRSGDKVDLVAEGKPQSHAPRSGHCPLAVFCAANAGTDKAQDGLTNPGADGAGPCAVWLQAARILGDDQWEG